MSKTRTLKRVVVTGMAGISPLGNDWPAVRAALERNESGIVRMKDWDEVDDLNTRVAAPAKPLRLIRRCSPASARAPWDAWRSWP